MRGSNGYNIEIVVELMLKTDGSLKVMSFRASPSSGHGGSGSEHKMRKYAIQDNMEDFVDSVNKQVVLQVDSAILTGSQYLPCRSNGYDSGITIMLRMSTEFICAATGQRVKSTIPASIS